MRRIAAILACVFLAGCDEVPPPAPSGAAPAGGGLSPRAAAQAYGQVVARVEPVAERECRARAPRLNCDFLIRVDNDRRAAPNAFQSEDETGRPVVTFTIALIESVQNADELAFVMGHEAAHHILSHLSRQRESAAAGAVIFGGLATLTGGSSADVSTAQRLGALVGARTYSKEYELEADSLGTVITARAGFNPVRGAAFFTRIPDPGNRFLGTHPPNAERAETVRRTARGLGLPAG